MIFNILNESLVEVIPSGPIDNVFICEYGDIYSILI